MRKIRDIISKPSEALRAMVDGLLEQSQREDFLIEMSDWGSATEKVCFGCAATCTLQKVAGINLMPGTQRYGVGNLDWRSDQLGLDENDVNHFENAMNDARMGDLETLFEYFDIDVQGLGLIRDYEWYLHNDNWRKQLPQVEETIQYLISKGV